MEPAVTMKIVGVLLMPTCLPRKTSESTAEANWPWGSMAKGMETPWD